MKIALVFGLFLGTAGWASPDSYLGTYECQYFGTNASAPNLSFTIEDKHFIRVNFRDGSEISGFGVRHLAPNGKSAAFKVANIYVGFREDGKIVYLDNWYCQKK